MKPFKHESRIGLLALAAGVPCSLDAFALLMTGDYSALLRWTVSAAILAGWTWAAMAARASVVFPMQTVANLLAGLREGDYSIRGRSHREDDAIGAVVREINQITEVVRYRRLDAIDATALLEKVMEEIDVAIFAFDASARLRLVNRVGERLLGRPRQRLFGAPGAELGLAECLTGDTPRLAEFDFAAGGARWELRRTSLIHQGKPHQLIVLSDLSRTLHEEERRAWQRLIRVLGHELNNSLTPISSVSSSLQTLIGRPDPPEDWEADLRQGLAVISSRAASLARFVESYTKLARIPRPTIEAVDLPALLRRVAGLETRMPVRVSGGPEVTVEADAGQIEQLVINLVRNAVDAALETRGGVEIGWTRIEDRRVEVQVIDEGPGITSTANLFVPFFTTKQGGSGIGLAMCRQIAEGHRGAVTLDNRPEGRGCIARLRLPIEGPDASRTREPARVRD